MMRTMDPTPLLDLAEHAAREGGRELLARFGGPIEGVERKSSPTDLVSDADRAAEQAVVSAIRAARPRDEVIAEEGDGEDGDSGLRWLVDPLDGTTNYLWGIPQWCVSVAAYDEHGALAAVVHDPMREETFRASRGGGCRLNGSRVRVRSAPSLSEALVGTGFNYSRAERARQAEALLEVLPEVRDIRRLGAAALDLAWVAAGRLDAYFETGLSPWDWAAGRLLVTEAGGVVRELPDHEGSPSMVLAGPEPLVEGIVAMLGRPV